MSCRNVEFLIVKSKSLCPQPGAVIERGEQGKTKGILYKSCGELKVIKSRKQITYLVLNSPKKRTKNF